MFESEIRDHFMASEMAILEVRTNTGSLTSANNGLPRFHLCRLAWRIHLGTHAEQLPPNNQIIRLLELWLPLYIHLDKSQRTARF